MNTKIIYMILEFIFQILGTVLGKSSSVALKLAKASNRKFDETA